MGIEDKLTRKYKRIIAVVSFVVVLGLMGLISYFAVFRFFGGSATAKDFESFISDYGWWGRFVALGIQFLQVFIALIPGEFVEVGLGLAFGAVEGTAICMVGVALASATVFLLVKRWGIKAVELFIDAEKINALKFINSEKKLHFLVFLLFLIPGTPKDLLCYIVPLTRIRLSEFMVITMIARIPSIVSSTIGGNLFGEGKYLEGIILLLTTGLISLAGLKIYDIIVRKYQSRKAENKGE
ncbi:MAG: TVP38/TMEM64 family protein [Clostridia bacterium]|nr:TVP38/TMEM64 family protein [Clostridia bacterium]